jgi:hypothetical protein
VKLKSLRRSPADTAAAAGGNLAGPGIKSEVPTLAKAIDSEADHRKFSLDPVIEFARLTVKGFLELLQATTFAGGKTFSRRNRTRAKARVT